MTAETDIVNVALRLIGADTITSLTDGTPNANAANDLYTEARDSLLRAHPWNWATKRKKLARSGTAPAYGYDYAYPLPSDWIRTLEVHNNDEGVGNTYFTVEVVNDKRCILSDEEDIYLRYVAKVTDVNMMPPDFRRTLEYALARDLAPRVSESNTLADRYTELAERHLSKARSTDGMGAPQPRRPVGSWVTSRFRFGPRVGDWRG